MFFNCYIKNEKIIFYKYNNIFIMEKNAKKKYYEFMYCLCHDDGYIIVSNGKNNKKNLEK